MNDVFTTDEMEFVEIFRRTGASPLLNVETRTTPGETESRQAVSRQRNGLGLPSREMLIAAAGGELDSASLRGSTRRPTKSHRARDPFAQSTRARRWLAGTGAVVIFAGVVGLMTVTIAAGHRLVDVTSATHSSGATAQSAASSSLMCSTRSQTEVYDVFTLQSPGQAQPRVSCAEAAATAEAHCPLNGFPCHAAPQPQMAELSVIKGYQGRPPADSNPPLLVWAVTWTPGNCSLPPGFSILVHPGSEVFDGYVGQWANSQGWLEAAKVDPTETCHWVTFIDAITGKDLNAAWEVGCARMHEGALYTACNPKPSKGPLG